MEYKEILGVISSALALFISLSYLYTMVRGKTRPHLYSVILDFITSAIVLAGAFVAGAGAGIWSLAIATSLVFVTIFFCFKYGTKDIRPIDAVFALAALLSIIPWILTKDPTFSVVLASLTAVLSVAPAIRKTWNDPYSEPAWLWGVNAIKHVFAIGATAVISTATIFYSVSIITLNVAFVLMMLYRRKKN